MKLKITILLLISFGTCVYASDNVDGILQSQSLWNQLVDSAQKNPFNVFATFIFILAIIHSFFYGEFLYLSHKLKHEGYHAKSFKELLVRYLHFLSEVEIIFALWLFPIIVGYVYYFGWHEMVEYLDDMAYSKGRFAEPVFVFVIMCISATRPIVSMAESLIKHVAMFWGNSIKAWWCCILIIGSLLGSFITEPAAIMICSMLLLHEFFKYEPSNKFKYATLGLLLVVISIGGTMTTFAAPPILMVKHAWHWDFMYMFEHFTWKSIIIVIVSVLVYARFFKSEFERMQKLKDENTSEIKLETSPIWLTAIHVSFLVCSIFLMHNTVLIVFLFLMFLGVLKITIPFQDNLKIENPLAVCIFLSSLVIHGSFQEWWIEPILSSLGQSQIFIGSIVLTSFNDNAAITYLATLAPNFPDTSKYLIVAGAVSGGGLTLIANAPNLAGATVLKSHFNNAISPLYLFLGAIPPTLLATVVFYFTA